MSFDKWMTTVSAAIFLGLGAWGLNSISGAKERVAVVETRVDNIAEGQKRIEDKLDRLLDNVIPRPRRGSEERRIEGAP